MSILKSGALLNKQKLIDGENVNKSSKYLSDIIHIYKTQEVNGNHLMYDVYIYEGKTESHAGNLAVGLTVLYPILIGDECNMTRGHFHKNTECSEIYFGVEGNGLLMLMNDEGDVWFEEVIEGSIHYIDGETAHRLINTSSSILKVGACWSQFAGHDYERVEENPFRVRVFNKNGKLEFEKEK
ncbi:MAG: glucose-6-phosphate isomerase family protein [Anaerorhabdus sp.]